MTFWRREPKRYTCGECGELLVSECQACSCVARYARIRTLRELHDTVFIAALGGRAARINLGNSIKAEIDIATQIADAVARDWARLEDAREEYIRGLVP